MDPPLTKVLGIRGELHKYVRDLHFILHVTVVVSYSVALNAHVAVELPKWQVGHEGCRGTYDRGAVAHPLCKLKNALQKRPLYRINIE